MADRSAYQHQYYEARKNNPRARVISTLGYSPPRVRSTYKIRQRHVFSGVVFRMAAFSGNPLLKLRVCF